jgi:hypothetical protein
LNTAAILTILGLGIGVAINPPGVSLVMLFLMSKNGLRKACVYVAGSIAAETFIICAVLALIYFFGNVTINPARKAAGPNDTIALIEAVFGLLLVISAILVFVKGSKAASPSSPLVERALKDVDRVPMWLSFAIGATLVSWTMPVVVAGQIVLAKDPLTLAALLLLYMLFMVFAMSSITFPILVVVLRPEKSADFLAKAREWLEKYGGRAAAVVTLGFGLFFLYTGVTKLLS